MDKQLKARLVSKLSAERGFDPAYTQKNREWFVGAALERVALTTSDAKAIEETTRLIIANANKRVKADRNFTVGVPLDRKTAELERKAVARRVETIYGVMAEKLELAGENQDTLRRFLFRRRYRGVVRMVYQVNPNSNGFLAYPKDCPNDRKMRLNKDAQPLWITASPSGAPVPLMIKGQNDPKTAVEAIFAKSFPNDVCQGNILDCGFGTGSVLMDTLLEAANPKMLFEKIVSRGPKHLLVMNPTLILSGNPHLLFEKDNEPKRLFSKELVAEQDLQIGDHVFLVNHGLYSRVAPIGDWSGEHALVAQCGNRSFADGKGFLFSGHGLNAPRTVAELYATLLTVLQTYLHRAYKIADLYFSFRKNKIRIEPSDREEQTFSVRIDPPPAPEVTVFAHKFIKPIVRYNNYDGVSGGSKPPQFSEGGTDRPLIIFEIPDRKEIRIAPELKGNSIDLQKQFINKMTVLVRTRNPTAGGSLFDNDLWDIPFLNSDTQKVEPFSLFEGPPKGAFKLLQSKEMPKIKFGRRQGSGTDTRADVTRPTLDISDAYVQFLRAVGAIP